jgi:hypothetical protein
LWNLPSKAQHAHGRDGVLSLPSSILQAKAGQPRSGVRCKHLFGHAERGWTMRRTDGEARHSAPRSGAEQWDQTCVLPILALLAILI